MTQFILTVVTLFMPMSLHTASHTDNPRTLTRSGQKLYAAGRMLPDTPGVYMMENVRREVIYVGKAVNLRKRVSSYTTPSAMKDSKVRKIVHGVDSLAYVETPSELEALLLESRLIKQFHPQFNRQLIEPDSCRWLMLTTGDGLPRVEIVGRASGISPCIGPLWSSSLLYDALEGVSNVFRLRRCSGILLPGEKKRACTLHDLGKCAGPCAGRVTEHEYALSVQAAWDSLSGESDFALRALTERRAFLAEQYRFEEAQVVHHQIRALEHIAAARENLLGASGDFALVVPSHLRRRPVILLFAEGRLGDKLVASPHLYPDEEMIANRLARLHISHRDLLPGKPSTDDLLIIQSYLRRNDLRNYACPLAPDTSARESARSLHAMVESLRRD